MCDSLIHRNMSRAEVYQNVESVLGTLLVLFDGGEHRQNQTGEHQQEPEQRTHAESQVSEY